MRVLVSGASGLVGGALRASLEMGGHQVVALVRPQSSASEGVRWDPVQGTIDAGGLEGFDAVVNLAGENLGRGRWTDDLKRRFWESRVDGTRLLADALTRVTRRPAVLVSASAIGYYGDRGEDEILTEDSPPGSGFLAELVQAWEGATQPAAEAGVRVVLLRSGLVLAEHGGPLAKMLPIFRLGLGGGLGNGRQYMSWVALDDAIGAVHHAVAREDLVGAVNLATPHSVTNAEFTKTLGRVLGRPTLFAVPEMALRLAFGEMAGEILLSSARVDPERLRQTAFTFQFLELETALRHVLRAK